MAETEQSDVAALTVQLLSAYLGNNTVAHTDIPELVRATRAALVEKAKPASVESEAPAYTPAVSVRRSLASPDHILSLIDGKPYKTLKRHLTSNGLTPDGYRARYNLPAAYPMVAPGFAQQRRAIAEKIGLGRRPAKSPAASPGNAKPVDGTISSERPTASVAANEPRSQRVSKALPPSSITGHKALSRPVPAVKPSASTKESAPEAAKLKTAESIAIGVKSRAAVKPASKPAVVKADKGSRPPVEVKAEPAVPKAGRPLKIVAKAFPSADAADRPVTKQTSSPAKAASGTPAKTKRARDKLGLFREVAEAAAARDMKKGINKNGPAAKDAEPTPSDNAVGGPSTTARSAASEV